MSKLFDKAKFFLKTGAVLENLGTAKPYVIRFKNIYIHVLETEDSYSVSWSDTPPDDVPIKKHMIAVGKY